VSTVVVLVAGCRGRLGGSIATHLIELARVESDRAGAERALASALDRVRSGASNRGGDDPIASVAEAFMWLKGLEDHHAAQLGNCAYYQRRDATDEGLTLGGLMWARNFFQHELLPAAHLILIVPPMVWRGGTRMVSTIVTGGPIYDYRWKPLSDLPARPDRNNRRLWYGRFVAGRELVPPLDAAVGWLRAIE